jgi:hypothetical protein
MSFHFFAFVITCVTRTLSVETKLPKILTQVLPELRTGYVLKVRNDVEFTASRSRGGLKYVAFLWQNNKIRRFATKCKNGNQLFRMSQERYWSELTMS